MRRRTFIRTVIIGGAGAAVAGVPLRRLYAEPPQTASPASVRWRRVVFEPAHRLRDGETFKVAPVSEKRDIVIVGAGAVGLTAGYHLRGTDFLMLEKEPQTGGTGHREEWNGIAYTTGTAYTNGEPSSPLGRYFEGELGLKLLPIHSQDAYIVGGKTVWKLFPDGIEQLPFPEKARREFRRFYERLRETGGHLGEEVFPLLEKGLSAVEAPRFREMDSLSLVQLMEREKAPKEFRDFAELYCPASVGGYPKNLSAAFACFAMGNWMGSYERNYTFPGGLGAANEVMRDRILASGSEHIRPNAFVVRVANTEDGKHVDVTYLHDGSDPRTVRCRTCLWAAPKFMARYAIAGMPKAQYEAIGKLVSHNLSVMNLCYRETVFDGAYPAWLPNLPIVDLVPADWVLAHGKGDPKRPQVLSCDWPVRPEDGALLLDDEWIVERCQETARGMEKLFPGSLTKLEEIRVYVRAHSWVAPSPGYFTRLQPELAHPVGKILITRSDQLYYELAYESGLEMAEQTRKLLAA